MSDSTKRKRSVLMQAWLTPEEAEAVYAKAEAAGMNASEVLRTAVFGYRPPPHSADRETAAKILADLGKMGSNLNQIAFHLNAGRPGDLIDARLVEALDEMLEWRTALMQFLGFERGP